MRPGRKGNGRFRAIGSESGHSTGRVNRHSLTDSEHVPSASIMRVDPPHIRVFISSTSKGTPYEPGVLDTGPYYETVMKTGQPLFVPDARENEAWKANPHVRLGMISYLGFPIGWPDGRLFGTICVRGNKRNEYREAYLKLMLHFSDMLQADLKSFATLHGQLELFALAATPAYAQYAQGPNCMAGATRAGLRPASRLRSYSRFNRQDLPISWRPSARRLNGADLRAALLRVSVRGPRQQPADRWRR
jgi:hypothetical protein